MSKRVHDSAPSSGGPRIQTSSAGCRTSVPARLMIVRMMSASIARTMTIQATV